VNHLSSLLTSFHPSFDDSLTTLVEELVTDEENKNFCLIPNEDEIVFGQ
jgi:hypothetical protein